MFRRTAKRSPIGVEITPDAVRLLQVDFDSEGGAVRASAEVPRPRAESDGAELSAALAAEVKTALRDLPFKGRRAVASLPPHLVIERHVKVDSISGQSLHDNLLFELEDAFPGDTPLVQYIHVGEVMERGEKRHEVILLAAGLESVNAYVSFLEEAGLEPDAIDAEGCALVRCFMRRRRRAADAERHVGIVHLGEAATLMVIAGQQRPLFMKHLPIGAAALIEQASQRLDLGPDDLRAVAAFDEEAAELAPEVVKALRLQLDSLVLELSACLRYHAASRRSPQGLDLYLSGRGSLLPGLADCLSQGLGVRFQTADPFTPAFTEVRAEGRLSRDFALWTVPLGLTLREAA